MIWKKKRDLIQFNETATRDITLIYNYLCLTDPKDPETAKKLYNKHLSTMNSVIGEDFLLRLTEFAQGGARTYEPCILCGNPAANGIFCDDCMADLGKSHMQQIGTPDDGSIVP